MTVQKVEAFAAWLVAHGLRPTTQRLWVAELCLGADDHPTGAQVVARARERMPSLGASTAWRTLALLADAGLVERHRIGGIVRYEEQSDEHHDHIVCVDCARLVEVSDPAIEARQHEIAGRLGFRVVDHVHEIAGQCLDARCPRRARTTARA